MEFLSDYGLFLAKSVTVLAVILVVLGAAGAVAGRKRARGDSGRIETRKVNDTLSDMRDALRRELLDDKALGKLRKAEAKAEKAARKRPGGGKADAERKRRVWVLRFEGDLQASATEALRREVTAILTFAEGGDEVVACIESPGGIVHGYGLAASQLRRIRDRDGLTLTVAVDRVAASGGYLMACIGHRIIAAPFAVLGSIGVIAQIPNFHRFLERREVDFEVLTAGEYKRTLTIFGENTDKGREKFVEELEDIHALFREFVSEHRPELDIDRVATGEAWHGRRAIDLGLVDDLETSDSYLARACDDADVVEVQWTEQKSPVERLVAQSTGRLAQAAERVLVRWRDRRTWTG